MINRTKNIATAKREAAFQRKVAAVAQAREQARAVIRSIHFGAIRDFKGANDFLRRGGIYEVKIPTAYSPYFQVFLGPERPVSVTGLSVHLENSSGRPVYTTGINRTPGSMGADALKGKTLMVLSRPRWLKPPVMAKLVSHFLPVVSSQYPRTNFTVSSFSQHFTWYSVKVMVGESTGYLVLNTVAPVNEFFLTRKL
jgi:hypothetical protein